LSKEQMLYGVYVIGTSLEAQEYPMDKVFSLFKEQYVVENANKYGSSRIIVDRVWIGFKDTQRGTSLNNL
ncbi:MAG: hypothetical protein AB1630_12455, partial [bacterium]